MTQEISTAAAPQRLDQLALQMRGVSKSFHGVPANHDVDLDVRWGEVHALLGENGAGKTTLMRLATGLYQADAGEIAFDGQPLRLRGPEDALELGIGMVHQHFTLVPTLTAAENIALRPAAFPRRHDRAALARKVVELSAGLGFEIDPHKLVSEATISERQRIEIVKLVHRGAELLIFDEPSAALTPSEWQDLARLIRALAAAGKAIILISHKLDEVFAVADRYTVLRDGGVAGSGDISGVTGGRLVELMVGREVKLRPDRAVLDRGPVVLSLRGVTVPRPESMRSSRPLLDDVDLEVHAHEILGIAGVSGNGQAELVEVLLGMRQRSAGTITMAGREIERPTASRFTEHGGALIPEDRHAAGVADALSIWENIMVRAALRPPFARRGLVSARAARRRAAELMAEYDVRAPGPSTRLGLLSGGNQQKAVIARELSVDPDIVVAVQPTRGLDVRASEFVYDKLGECKRRGGGVLLISMDLDEILALSDRIAVIADGRIRGVLTAAEADTETIGALMTGGHHS